ncbi:type II secretion system protein GspJ [Candidatus Magnetoovum chiemensis]|nr:type II secretion system protein GspJ [Candidatus Magnetoovum chiemensis]
MRGFTLLEIIIAVFIFSIIITALYSTYNLTQKAVYSVDNYMLKLQETNAVMDSLRKEIESAFYSSKDNTTFFKTADRDSYGRQTSELYLTTFAGLGAGLESIAYYVKEDGSTLTLMKTISSIYSQSTPIDVELIEDIKGFAILLSDKEKSLKTWDSSELKSLPYSVRVFITINLNDEDFTLFETITPKIR